MIPRNIEVEHILKAVKDIDRDRVPPRRRSDYYDLVVNQKRYPPKYVISVANKYANSSELPSGKFNAVEAKNYLTRLKFQVSDRRENRKIKIAAEDEESAYPEGRERYKKHRSLERDSRIVKSKKIKRLKKTGKLQCDVCSFDFKEMYGEIGEGFIEAHHSVPVAELGGKRKTRESELALVCSNCHRMLHRGNTLLSIEELKSRVV